jgi:hypothetical protein
MKKLILVLLIMGVSSTSYARRGGLGKIFSKIVGYKAGTTAAEMLSGDKNSVEKVLRTVAQEQNKQLPMLIDSDVRLNAMSAGPGKRLNYHYTYINYPASHFDQAEFRRLMKQELRTNICSSKGMQVFIKSKITLVYSYAGKYGGKISDIFIFPSDCGYR